MPAERRSLTRDVFRSTMYQEIRLTTMSTTEDERDADAVRQDAVETWLRAHPDAAEPYLAPDVEGQRAQWVVRSHWPILVRDR